MPDTVASVVQHRGSHVWSVSPDSYVYDSIALMAGKSITHLHEYIVGSQAIPRSA